MQRKLHAPCEWGEKPEAESQGLTYPYPTNVAISKAGLSRNLQAVWTARIGLRATGNGKTEAMSRRQATSSSLIGRAMEKQTTLDLWSVLRTEQFILLRVILAMLVVRTAMLSAAA